jgi:hypothetical protein
MNTLAELLSFLATPEAVTASAPAGIDDARLAALETEATETFSASRASGTPDLAAGRAAMTVRAGRASAAEAASIADALAPVVPAAPDPADPAAAAVDLGPVVEPPAAPVAPAADPVVEVPALAMVAANADRTAIDIPVVPTPSRSRSVVASRGDVFSGTAPADDIYDETQATTVLANSFARLASFGGTGTVVPFQPVVRHVAYNLSENDQKRLNDRMDPRTAAALIRSNTADQRVEVVTVENPLAKRLSEAGASLPTARTAAVFCGPTANSFAVGITPTGGTPIFDSFPKDPSSRGRFRTRPDVGLASLGTIDLDEPRIPWNVDTNAGARNGSAVVCTDTTTCFTPGCLNEELLVQMLTWRLCFRYQGTSEITDPEGLAAQLALFDIAQDRQKELIMMAYLQAAAQLGLSYYSWADTTTGYGGIPDFLRVLNVTLSPAGWTGRFDAGAGYTLYMPERVATWMALDELSREFVPTTEALNTAAALVQNPTSVFSRFMPGLRVVQYKDDPIFGAGATFTVPQAADPAPAATSVAIKSLAAASYSLAAGAGAGGAVTPTSLPAESIQTFRIWLAPTEESRIADTGVTEIGPDRVTEAGCDIVRLNSFERWVPYQSDALRNKKVYAADLSLEFNGARAGAVTPY